MQFCFVSGFISGLAVSVIVQRIRLVLVVDNGSNTPMGYRRWPTATVVFGPGSGPDSIQSMQM